MITVEAAGKVYVTAAREIWAVRDISLSVAEGEFVSVVGPSGCGKSTLLHMIAGFEAPTAGEIRVAGTRVAGEIPKGLGYIFQKDTVLPWYTVRHNIALGLRYRGRPKREMTPRSTYGSYLPESMEARAIPAMVAPGATTLTRMSAGPPYSFARMRPACTSAAFGPA